MKIAKKILSTLKTILLIFFVFLAYGSLGNRWYRIITLEGNSMSPTLWIGDLIVVTPAPDDIKSIPLDTIVVMNADGALVTHRLVGFDGDDRPITKGDANEVVDAFENPNIRIVGIFRLRVPWAGYPLMYLKQLVQRGG